MAEPTPTFTAWEDYWTVWKLRDGELVSYGREYATEEEARAVADGLTHTETKVDHGSRITNRVPEHLRVTWDDIETVFHEYTSQLTRDELAARVETSYWPEFADWGVGCAAAKQWLADHDAQVRAQAQAEILREAAADWSDWDALDAPEAYLRARADRIEREASR